MPTHAFLKLPTFPLKVAVMGFGTKEGSHTAPPRWHAMGSFFPPNELLENVPSLRTNTETQNLPEFLYENQEGKDILNLK